MEYDVRLEQHGGIPLAVVRRRASAPELSKVITDACGTVWNVVKEQQITGAGRHVAVYLDSQIQMEIGVEVSGEFAGNGRVVPSSTPAGPVATTFHLGPYHRLGEAHAAILRWCEAHRRPLAGPSWEIYGHWDDDPSKRRTDVFYRLPGA